jgi:serine/threonine-protein kinase
MCGAQTAAAPSPAPAAPSLAAPTAQTPAATADEGAKTVLAQATAIAGRFLAQGDGVATPTGRVFEAFDTQREGAACRLKLVPTEVLPTPSMADRALRELKQLGKVASPKIVKVLDQGRTSDGQVYVATDAVSGQTLDELVKKAGPLPLDRAVAITLQIGEALTEAQKVGVIHRDVCPRNVVVGEGDQVQVSDFGLGEPVTDKVFGAPAYLSPEQVEGKPVDQRSNIYSLGCVLHFLTTGRPPFAGDAQALLLHHRESAPQAPGVSPEIDRVILKALEKQSGRRHLTLRQMLTDLENAQRNTHSASPAAEARPQAVVVEPTRPRPEAPSTVMGLQTRGSSPQIVAARPAPATPPANEAVTVQAPAPAPQVVAMAQTTAPPVATPVAAEPAPARVPASASPEVQAAVAKAQAQVAARQAQQPKPAAGKAGFRETAWFKAGEIEEEMAKRQAEAGDDPLKAGTTGEHAVVAGQVDASKVDVSAEDRARLSLKTGATQAMPVIKADPGAVPGEQMDEREMLAEIDSSKKWLLIAGIAAGVAVLGIVLYLLLGRSPSAEGPPAEAPKAVATAPPAPAPSPPPSPSPSPPSAENPAAKMLEDADAALKKGDHAQAVELLTRAAAAGADAGKLGKSAGALDKALQKRALAAKKKKDRAGEAQARALAARLKPLLAKKK